MKKENKINKYIIDKFVESAIFKELKKCDQIKEYHPEGDAYVHSTLAGDFVEVLADDNVLLFAALAHDIGKIKTKGFNKGKITYYGHDLAGESIVREFCRDNHISVSETEKVCCLVKYHMIPMKYKEAKKAAFKKLAKILKKANVSLWELIIICSADAFASNGDYSDLQLFGKKYKEFVEDDGDNYGYKKSTEG